MNFGLFFYKQAYKKDGTIKNTRGINKILDLLYFQENAQVEKKKIDCHKNILLKMREQVLEQVKSEKKRESLKETSGEHSYSFHIADQGSDCNEHEKAYLIASMDGNTLESLDEALERIEDGTYGECVLCGSGINPKRLEALPNAKLCIDCKSNEEKEKF